MTNLSVKVPAVERIVVERVGSGRSHPSSCPICDGEVRAFRSELPTVIDGERTDVYECAICRARFAWPLVVPDGLYEAVYSQSDRLPGYARYARYARRSRRCGDPLGYLAAQEDMYWAVSKSVTRIASAASRIVEVGSGLGYLTNALRHAGYDCVGIDISRSAVEQARARFGPWYERRNIFEPSPADAARYDLAVLLETIEHVPDPVAFVRATADLLAPGGSIVLTTPNRDAHPERAVWRTDLPPVHLFWFGEKAVERLAAQAGMAVELVDFSEFNRDHVQTVDTRAADGRARPWFDGDLRFTGAIPLRTTVMEHLREYPPLARLTRAAYDRIRPGRERLTTRSFSLAAVLTPKG